MRVLPRLLAAAAALLVLAPPGARADDAFATSRRMGRGVNVLGYDGLWDGGTDAPFRRADFGLIRRAGFGHVRINLHAFKYMDGAGRLDPAVLRHLDWAVEGAVSAGLVPVVDEHDFASCQRDPEDCARRLKAFWRELSVHYAGRIPSLVFELLNEPGGNLSPQAWNVLAAELLAIVRAGNPDRTVVVAAINDDDPDVLRALALPERDRNIIVTVHYYKPMRFTHQGASWGEFAGVRGVDWGTPADEAAVRADLRAVADWAEQARRPIYLGEFGVYEAAGFARRARWLSFVAREAERHGWSWAAWQFDHDFALFDQETRRWHGELVRALIPSSPASLAPTPRLRRALNASRP